MSRLIERIRRFFSSSEIDEETAMWREIGRQIAIAKNALSQGGKK